MPNMVEAVILCGGAGLRLRGVTDAPKSMAAVAGRPFLELLLRQLRRHGVERVVLAVGYRWDVIRSHFGEEAFGLKLAYSIESAPLGTGGALRNAAALIQTDLALVLNGDSYTDADLGRMVAYHRSRQADVCVLAVPVEGRDDGGTMRLGPDNRLLAFREKQIPAGEQYLNAGIYTVSQPMFREIEPDVPVSLEQEIFPRWIAQGRLIQVFVERSPCVDIGTAERYRVAQTVLANVEESNVRL